MAASTLRVTATAGSPTVTTGPPSPVDERVAALEARLAELERQLDSERDRVDYRIRDLASAGLRAEAWGIGLFLVGTVLSTVPDELAGLLRGIG